MNKSTYIILLATLVMIVASCQSKDKEVTLTEVKHSGALRTIMSGNLQPVISLDSLSNKRHLYALGAVENLKGEIQIFDSKPSNSYVVDSSVQIKDSYSLRAALFVYAEIEEWDEFIIEKVTTKDELEEAIFETAKTNGFNKEKPFPFLLDGQVATLNWHVINWKEGDTIHTHDKHKESGLSGALRNAEIEILGFYSIKHKAIFTHHTTNMHLHFKTKDNTIAGHIDDLMLNKKIILKLPKQ